MRNVQLLLGFSLATVIGAGCSLQKWDDLKYNTAGSSGVDVGGGGTAGDGATGGKSVRGGTTATGGTSTTGGSSSSINSASPNGGTKNGNTTFESITGGATVAGTSNIGGNSSYSGTSNNGGTGATGSALTCGNGYVFYGAGCVALLSALTVSNGKLSSAFSPIVSTYVTSVNADTTIVAAASPITGAVIKINGVVVDSLTVNLAVPVTTVTVNVTVSGVSANYTIAINRFGSQQAYIKASNTGTDDAFGSSVALSGDGNTIAVGAWGEDSSTVSDQASTGALGSGAVYVFVRVDNAWKQQAYLKATTPQASAGFGYGVTLSRDGNTLAVGAADESEGSNLNVGATYVFTRSTETWSAPIRITASNAAVSDEFGYSVALSADGQTLAVGAVAETSPITGVVNTLPKDDNTGVSAGAVYLFVRGATGWSQQAFLKAPNPGDGDRFGRELALSADGSRIVVGALWESGATPGVVNAPNAIPLNVDVVNGSYGAAYVYSRLGSTWTWSAYLKASNPSPQDWFSYSVDITDDGKTIVVGAPFESSANATNPEKDDLDASGAVYLFSLGSSGWYESAFIKAKSPQKDVQFGKSVALSSDGAALTVGAAYENYTPIIGSTVESVGAVYLFRNIAGTWTQQTRVFASNPDTKDEFGWRLSLSDDGSTAVVAAARESSAGTDVDSPYQSNNSAPGSGAVYVKIF